MVQFLHFKEQMKSICVHEFLREKGALCPKIQVNEAVETVKQVVENTEQEARDRGV